MSETPTTPASGSLPITCPNCRKGQDVPASAQQTTCTGCGKHIRCVQCDNCERYFTTVRKRRFQCPACLNILKGKNAKAATFHDLAEQQDKFPESAIVTAAALHEANSGGSRVRWGVVCVAAVVLVAAVVGIAAAVSNKKPHHPSASSHPTTTTSSSTTTTTTSTIPIVVTIPTTTVPPPPPTTTVQRPTPTTTIPPTTTTTTTCPRGAPTSSISIENSTQEPDGLWDITVGGTVTNSATGSVSNVVVSWEITYAGGTVDKSESTLINGGGTLTSKSTTSWTAQPARSDGSSTPESANVTGVTYQYTSPCP